jgi:hypothetical protein
MTKYLEHVNAHTFYTSDLLLNCKKLFREGNLPEKNNLNLNISGTDWDGAPNQACYIVETQMNIGIVF